MNNLHFILTVSKNYTKDHSFWSIQVRSGEVWTNYSVLEVEKL